MVADRRRGSLRVYGIWRAEYIARWQTGKSERGKRAVDNLHPGRATQWEQHFSCLLACLFFIGATFCTFFESISIHFRFHFIHLIHFWVSYYFFADQRSHQLRYSMGHNQLRKTAFFQVSVLTEKILALSSRTICLSVHPYRERVPTNCVPRTLRVYQSRGGLGRTGESGGHCSPQCPSLGLGGRGLSSKVWDRLNSDGREEGGGVLECLGVPAKIPGGWRSGGGTDFCSSNCNRLEVQAA